MPVPWPVGLWRVRVVKLLGDDGGLKRPTCFGVAPGAVRCTWLYSRAITMASVDRYALL